MATATLVRDYSSIVTFPTNDSTFLSRTKFGFLIPSSAIAKASQPQAHEPPSDGFNPDSTTESGVP